MNVDSSESIMKGLGLGLSALEVLYPTPHDFLLSALNGAEGETEESEICVSEAAEG